MKEYLYREGQQNDFRDFAFVLYGYKEDFIELVAKTSKILDAGCGNGYFLQYLQERGYKNIWGIDIVGEAVKQTKEKVGALLTIQEMDIHSTDFPDSFFDAVSASHILEHTPFPKVVIREIVRITKPGGFVFFDIPIEHTNEGSSAHLFYFHKPEEFLAYLSKVNVIKSQLGYGDYSNHFVVIGIVVK